jgi:UDP-N-acetylglucosamine transferase subunit ALG13
MGKVKPLILFAPLDWGFGHTTRCIPLIRQALLEGAEVVVACNSDQKALIEPEIRGICFVDLEGYAVRYSSSGWATVLRLILQIPKILIAVNREHTWLRQYLEKNTVSAIVSDNRFGFYSTACRSIFITHQINIRTGTGKLIDAIASRINRSLISRFSECWIPDTGKSPSLAGALALASSAPIPVKRIGVLSDFTTISVTRYRYRYLFLLSGPEPQRTLFENIILGMKHKWRPHSILIRGLLSTPISSHDESIIDYAGRSQLNKLICDAEFVVCRSGYTTLMELTSLRKKVITVATPGQGEQQYLARYWHDSGIAATIDQEDLSWDTLTQTSRSFNFATVADAFPEYADAIRNLVQI